MKTFIRDEILPSWWANALDAFLLPMASSNFRLKRTTANPNTQIEVIAGSGEDRVAIAIDGLWRYRNTTVQRSHPGGAAGYFTVWVTTGPNVIVNTPAPNTDTTNYSFDLAITTEGSEPAVVAGTVEFWRKVGRIHWDGSAIIELEQTVGVPELGIGSVTPEKLDTPLAQTLGVSTPAVVRRGKSVITGEEFLTWAAGEFSGDPNFTTNPKTMPTPDRVAAVRVENDGILKIRFHAMWKATGSDGSSHPGNVISGARANVYIGGNRVKAVSPIGPGGVPVEVADAMNQVVVSAVQQNIQRYRPLWILSSGPGSLEAQLAADLLETPAAGGLAVSMTTNVFGAPLVAASGAMEVRGLPAGTYDVEIRYNMIWVASSPEAGRTTTRLYSKSRRLWVASEAF